MGNRYQGGYPTREVASEAINGLRMSINEDRHRRQDRTITVADLADHYTRVELCDGSHVHTAACVLAGILMQHADPGDGLPDPGIAQFVAASRQPSSSTLVIPMHETSVRS
jgi:hypothetical protein